MPFLEIKNGKHVQIGSCHSVAVYRDHVDLPGDYEVIVAQEALISSHGHFVQTPASPQKGQTTWVFGESWMPEDDMEIFLDPSDAWHNKELNREVYDSHIFQQAGIKKTYKKGK
ncbi:hypothetical protein ARMGADRAFT_1092817 [Armillaria gallica]|uniref:Uncharacterized protein n=1 Tax=Armillaria gallica TaxID=47427 RepID=A0A2H3CWS3_ARMGA|nr:hypothetical protein ARMGADRAFT_1092817 [Armillaria gallica]